MAATEIKVQMQQRRDTASGWTSADPTLLSGEFGYETDTGKFKVGDGSTAWSSLSYIPGLSVSSYPLSTADIANDAITADKLAHTSVTAGSYTAADITVDAQGRLTSAASGTISTAEIANDAVTAAKLADTAVTAGSYTAADITVDAQGRITAAASGTVGTAELADNSVTGDKLADDITIANDLTVTNNLTVNGTTTTINSTTLQVDDKNIELGTVATPTDTTADGGGITLKGATDHTITWTNSTDSWDFSEHVNIASGKEFQIAGTSVLNASTLGSGVTGSSLTSVGTITTGVWNGTAIATAYIANDAITTAKIAASAVGTTEIADDAVTAAKIADTSVTAGSYTAADITVDAQGRITAASSGSLSSAEIADSAITTAKIADDAVTAAKLADTAVTAGSYTAADITVDAQGRITAAANGEISTGEIANDAVTAAKLADTAVTAGSYTAADITVDAQGRITAAANGSIAEAEIANGSVTTAKIADDAVTAAKLADTAVTAGSYTAANITVDAQGRVTSAANGSGITVGDTSISVTDTGSDGTITFDTDGSEVARLSSSGNFGIGATDVNAPLEVRNSSALQIRTSTGTGTYWQFGRDNSTGDFFLADDGLGTVVAVDQITGAVGIGTTSPAFTEGNGLRIERASTATLRLQDTGAHGFEISASSTEAKFRSMNNKPFVFANSSDSELMRITGTGIAFNGDTAEANKLNDYEEGTFTPEFAGATTAGTYTYASRTGHYTKIGDMVNVTIMLSNINTSTAGTGNINITGLPFTSANNSSFACGTVILDQFNAAGTTVSLAVRNSPNTAILAIHETRDSLTDTILDVGDKVTNVADILCTITYRV